MALADGPVTGSLDAQGQAEDLDEADSRGVIEGVALVVGGQALVVQRQRGAASSDGREGYRVRSSTMSGIYTMGGRIVTYGPR